MPWILVAIVVLLLLSAGATVLAVRRRPGREMSPSDYRAFLPVGVSLLATGIALMVVFSFATAVPLYAVGATFIAIGLSRERAG